jgi:hypothetical protein
MTSISKPAVTAGLYPTPSTRPTPTTPGATRPGPTTPGTITALPYPLPGPIGGGPVLPGPTPLPYPQPSPFPGGPIAGPFPFPTPLPTPLPYPNPGPFPGPFPGPTPPPTLKDRLATPDRSARLADRQADQLEDIQQGVRNGTVSQDEASRLLGQQSRISSATARATADGVVTAAEAAQIRRLQAQADNSIFEATTSREFRPSTQDPSVTERQAQQISNIAEGVRNGTITGAEARRLLTEQVGIANAVGQQQDSFGSDPLGGLQVLLKQLQAGLNIYQEQTDFQKAPHARRNELPTLPTPPRVPDRFF